MATAPEVPDGAVEAWLARYIGASAARVLWSFALKALILAAIALLSVLTDHVTRSCIPRAIPFVLPVAQLVESVCILLLIVLLPFELLRYVRHAVSRGGPPRGRGKTH